MKFDQTPNPEQNTEKQQGDTDMPVDVHDFPALSKAIKQWSGTLEGANISREEIETDYKAMWQQVQERVDWMKTKDSIGQSAEAAGSVKPDTLDSRLWPVYVAIETKNLSQFNQAIGDLAMYAVETDGQAMAIHNELVVMQDAIRAMQALDTSTNMHKDAMNLKSSGEV